ncbi:MAG TPA: radical SAM protein [Ignavibacteriaceae bacterium]|nr:radical SAM protein [Ignavibacteriaceae bacterium]
MNFIPSYIRLLKSGELYRRSEAAYKNLLSCTSCPRNCKVDRVNGEYGICTSGHLPVVSSYTPHFGEEPVLSGTRGAGNIFFGNCNLKCIYCQNFEISQNPAAEKNNEVSHERLAEIMLELHNKKCHNIGLVSPTHFSATILKSIYLAAEKGLNLPIIYNTNGYDSVEMLKLYDGVADIYLPDFKYGSSEYAKKYSLVDNYFEKAKEAVKEMFRQVGDELVYEGGIVVSGLIIRHLILPNDLSETEKVFKFIAEELSPNVHISLMSQYYPANKSYKDILINRPLRKSEHERALRLLDKYGLHNGWTQELESAETYRPDFNKDRRNPFNN